MSSNGFVERGILFWHLSKIQRRYGISTFGSVLINSFLESGSSYMVSAQATNPREGHTGMKITAMSRIHGFRNNMQIRPTRITVVIDRGCICIRLYLVAAHTCMRMVDRIRGRSYLLTNLRRRIASFKPMCMNISIPREIQWTLKL